MTPVTAIVRLFDPIGTDVEEDSTSQAFLKRHGDKKVIQ